MPSINVRMELDVYGALYMQRRCTQCATWLPQTAEHFAHNSNTGRFNSWCKPCVRRRNAERSGYGAMTDFTQRRFGVEIEFIGSAPAVLTAMREQGLACVSNGYNHQVSTTTWKIVPDGSVAGGAELVSPVLQGADGASQLLAASRALVAAGATVNRSTGLHVHHEIRRLRVTAFHQLVNNWSGSQSAIDGLVAESRRAGRNQFCGHLSDEDVRLLLSHQSMNQVRSYCMTTRYRTINFTCYPRYGTVEIRQHQGTTDAEKIIAWMRFGQAMIAAAERGIVLQETQAAVLLTKLHAAGLLDDAMHEYLQSRATKFAGVSEGVNA